MAKLDESPDFRPFKFRIQAFTNAFAEEVCPVAQACTRVMANNLFSLLGLASDTWGIGRNSIREEDQVLLVEPKVDLSL